MCLTKFLKISIFHINESQRNFLNQNFLIEQIFKHWAKITTLDPYTQAKCVLSSQACRCAYGLFVYNSGNVQPISLRRLQLLSHFEVWVRYANY